MPTEPKQHLYTICSKIKADAKNRLTRDDDIRQEIEKLGNPAKTDMRNALLATGCIHFMSLSVISGGSDLEPSYLVMEMGADGHEDDVIAAIKTHAGEKILPIYKAACGVKNTDKLGRHLESHAIDLAQSSWPEFLSGKRRNGLGFSGTAGLSVKRIQAEKKISDFARHVIDRPSPAHNRPVNASPLDILKEVRAELKTPAPDMGRPQFRNADWVLDGSKPPNFAEKSDSPWKLTGGVMDMVTRMFPRAFITYFGLLYLVIVGLVSATLFDGENTKEGLCGPPLKCIPPGANNTNLLANPIWPKDLPNGVDQLFIYHSPLNIVWAIFAAFVISIFIAIILGWLRKFSDKFLNFGFSHIGAVFYMIVGFIGFIAYQSAYEHLPSWLQWNRFEGQAFDFYRIDQALWLWAAVITIFIAIIALSLKWVRIRSLPSVILTTYLMAMTVLTIGAHQYLIFTIPSGHTGDVTVLNRWNDAGLHHLIFYPLLIALILHAAFHSFNVTFPRLKLFKKAWYLLGVFAVSFLAVFVTTFFAWDVVKDGNFVSILLWGFMIPLFVSMILMGIYLKLNGYLLGKKYSFKTFLIYSLSLAAIISLTLHMDVWATPRSGQILMSFILAIPLTVMAIAAFAALLFKLIRRSEIRNKPHDADAQTRNIDTIMTRENQVVAQNHMISVVRLIPEQFRRRFTLPLALNIILTGLANHKARPGFLGSIGTVHYARWVHLPKTNNYVFYSNYDGSFENYLEDFITKASFGLTGAWSHSVGFPETNLLFLKGSRDGDRFKRYARGSMIPTPFWFSAYPHLSAEEIRRNALIRDGLARIETLSDAEAWLDLFGSRTRPSHVIQTERIQSIMFTGTGRLHAGACLVVKSGDGEAESDTFKTWLRSVLPDITYGETSPHERATYIALGKGGLIRLGLRDDIEHNESWAGAEELIGEPPRTKFPPVLAMGMDNPNRRNVLGDVGADAPEKWKWGSGDNPAHAVLLVYAANEDLLDAYIKSQTNLMAAHNISCQEIRFKNLLLDEIKTLEDQKQALEEQKDKNIKKEINLAREPFGFVDGVSQPIIRGTQRAMGQEKSIHFVQAGEFILGYKDNRDFYPSSPQIEARRDTGHDLPNTVTGQPERYPRFEGTKPDSLRDLGRNGSFLVIRQLEQAVTEFGDVTKNIAESLCPANADTNRIRKTQKVIQAKMMGRWQDGRSFMENPVRISHDAEGFKTFKFKDELASTRAFNNEFLFNEHDPQGNACPYGSHIRRANPRDGMEPDSPDALDIVNRHRILRRGRTYVDGNATGTFFMCLNADIDRQFEFVQQTWIASSKFHGLSNEVDPITAQGIHRGEDEEGRLKHNPKTGLSYTIQAEGPEIPLEGLKSFVTMKGGGYFFLPSRDALKFMCRP